MSMRRIAALSCLVLALAGCASTTTTSPASEGAPASSPAAVALDEHANHTTVKVARGATVTIELHNTYWSAVTSSAPTVLEAAPPSPHPSPSPTPCHPIGSGCGTVTTSFQARTDGTAQLTAERSTCGEAMACTPDQKTYAVTIDVTG